MQALQPATMPMPTNKIAPVGAASAESAYQSVPEQEHASTASALDHAIQGRRRRWSLREPPASSGPAQERWGSQDKWRTELLDFASGPSIELCVLRDQVNAGDEKLQRLTCQQGDVVTGTSRLIIGSLEAVWCVVYKDGIRNEGFVPRLECRPCDPYEFTLRVPDTAANASAMLGLEGSVKSHGLEVHAVRAGGIVESWNDDCTRTVMRDMVRVGDIIVSINGSRDLADMLKLLRGAGCAQVCVRRNALSGLRRPLLSA